MKETEQKQKGQWMTPDDIAKHMIDFAPQEWYKDNILEPTAGNGQLVIQILNRKVELGMTPQEAIDTTYANEFDEVVSSLVTTPVRNSGNLFLSVKICLFKLRIETLSSCCSSAKFHLNGPRNLTSPLQDSSS